ncbi:MAG: type II toxin-antitoxin system HicA family toxin [Deltaproteobacteria bacterium]|nr:type II toxin-antitoxin system HicA family toxin [Deltaproteobacteria bacterium]
MNSRHRKTLTAIFAKPQNSPIDWADIEALLIAVGAELIEGRGSRARFVAGDLTITFHRPHPRKEAKAYQIRDARIFLEMMGVKP